MMRALKRRKKAARPVVETLEEMTLLSGVHTLANPPVSQVQQFQSHASSDNLVDFLSSLAMVETSRGDVQQYAQSVLQSHQTTDPTIHQIAQSMNVLLPSNITSAGDQAIAKQVLATVNTSNFDQTYLTAMKNLEPLRVQAAQNFINSTTNTALQQVLQTEITADNQAATQAQTLLSGLGSGNGGSVTAGSGTDSPTNDAQYLQWASSTDNSEILMSQAAALLSSNLGTQLYAQKLMYDHGHDLMDVNSLASYQGTTLSVMPTPLQYAVARNVLFSLLNGSQNTTTATNGRLSTFDQTYLTVNVLTHNAGINTNAQEVSRTQDPNFSQYATDDIGTDFMHQTAAQQLLALYNNTSVTGGNPFTPLIVGIQAGQVTNVNEKVTGPRNGRLTYSVTFDSGGLHYNQTYSLVVTGRGGQAGGVTLQQAVGLFGYLGYNRAVAAGLITPQG